jgi:hypothetical protein
MPPSTPYRRLVNWFNLNLKGAGEREATDRLAATMEAAEAAMKKHGIIAMKGVMGTIVPAAIVAAFGQPLTVVAGLGAALFGGQLVASFWETRLTNKGEIRSGPAAYVRRLEGLEGLDRISVPGDETKAVPPGRGP